MNAQDLRLTLGQVQVSDKTAVWFVNKWTFIVESILLFFLPNFFFIINYDCIIGHISAMPSLTPFEMAEETHGQNENIIFKDHKWHHLI